jgi:hypothetical protein
MKYSELVHSIAEELLERVTTQDIEHFKHVASEAEPVAVDTFDKYKDTVNKERNKVATGIRNMRTAKKEMSGSKWQLGSPVDYHYDMLASELDWTKEEDKDFPDLPPRHVPSAFAALQKAYKKIG